MRKIELTENEKFSSIRMKRNSLVHNILMISKVYNKIISVEDLDAINPKKFKERYRVRHALLRLSLDNLINLFEDETWTITDDGVRYLYYFVTKNPRHTSMSKED